MTPVLLLLLQTFQTAPQVPDSEQPRPPKKAPAPEFKAAPEQPRRPVEPGLEDTAGPPPTPRSRWRPASDSEPSRRGPPLVRPLNPEDQVQMPTPVTSISPASVSAPRVQRSEGPVADLIARSQEDVPVTTLIDEMLDDLVVALKKEDARALSPMAIRWIKLSPNLRADLAVSIETRLSARLAKATDIVQVVCTDCRALRSRVEAGEWVVSLGAVRQADLRQIADDLGAKTFMDIDVTYLPGPDSNVTLAARAFRASDGRVLFASALRADETTAAVLRTGHAVETREEKLKELENKLEGRPAYGQIAYLGAGWMPYDSPQGGFTGAIIGYKVYERFGIDRRYMYGLQAEGFLNARPGGGLQGGEIGAAFSWDATEPNLNKPDLRINWVLGAFLAGSDVSDPNSPSVIGSMILETGADYIMKFRFSFGAGLFYMLPVKMGLYDLGGFGMKTRFAFNW